MTNNRINQLNQVEAKHISDNKNTGSNRSSLIKTKWKKPLAALLSLSILAGMSNTCLANQKDVQGDNEQQIDTLNSQNTKTETDEIRREEKTNEKEIGEEFLKHKTAVQKHEEKQENSDTGEVREEEFINFKQKVKLYNSLNSLTKSFLAVTGSWDVSGNLTPESEELIKEDDTIISQSSELNQLTDEEKKKLWALMFKLRSIKTIHDR